MLITPHHVIIDGLHYRFVSGSVSQETTVAECAGGAMPAPMNGPKVWRIDMMLSRRRRAQHITGVYAHARAWDYGKRLELSGRI